MFESLRQRFAAVAMVSALADLWLLVLPAFFFAGCAAALLGAVAIPPLPLSPAARAAAVSAAAPLDEDSPPAHAAASSTMASIRRSISDPWGDKRMGGGMARGG
jgi:hypothetical protein